VIPQRGILRGSPFLLSRDSRGTAMALVKK